MTGPAIQTWLTPTFGALMLWGLWSFIPKITTQYIGPKSAIIYEVFGAILIAAVVLFSLNFRLDTHPKGIALAITTGMLGFLGALFFLMAVSKGPLTLVAAFSALYPVVSILLAISFLHEALTVRQGVGIFLAILAMVLVAA